MDAVELVVHRDWGDPTSRGETRLKSAIALFVSSKALKAELREWKREGIPRVDFGLLPSTRQPGMHVEKWLLGGEALGEALEGAEPTHNGPTFEEMLRIVVAKEATETQKATAQGAAKAALGVAGALRDKLFTLRATSERRGVNVESPDFLETTLTHLSGNAVPSGGAALAHPVFKSSLRDRTKTRLDVLRQIQAAAGGIPVHPSFQDLVDAAVKAQGDIDRDLVEAAGTSWAEQYIRAEMGLEPPQAAAPMRARARRAPVVAAPSTIAAMGMQLAQQDREEAYFEQQAYAAGHVPGNAGYYVPSQMAPIGATPGQDLGQRVTRLESDLGALKVSVETSATAMTSALERIEQRQMAEAAKPSVVKGKDGKLFEKIKCFGCECMGHYLRQCPSKRNTGDLSRSKRHVLHEAAAIERVPDGCDVDVIEQFGGIAALQVWVKGTLPLDPSPAVTVLPAQGISEQHGAANSSAEAARGACPSCNPTNRSTEVAEGLRASEDSGGQSRSAVSPPSVSVSVTRVNRVDSKQHMPNLEFGPNQDSGNKPTLDSLANATVTQGFNSQIHPHIGVCLACSGLRRGPPADTTPSTGASSTRGGQLATGATYAGEPHNSGGTETQLKQQEATTQQRQMGKVLNNTVTLSLGVSTTSLLCARVHIGLPGISTMQGYWLPWDSPMRRCQKARHMDTRSMCPCLVQ